MKRTISTMICIAAAALAFTACDDDTEYRLAEAPAVTLSPSSITLSAEAVESYTINYTVSSPGEGASVSAAADVSWISGVDASVSGQVRLSVAANASDGMRTGAVTLTYSYDGGAVTARAAVVQYGAGDPVLTVDPNAVVASAEGGTYSFGYALENPIDGESVSCTSDEGWVSGFDYSSYGTVSFTVEASEEEGLRTATITVSYASLSKEVTVVQDHPGDGTGGGGGDFDGSIDSLVGTYTAGGYAYYDSGVAAYTTWTLTIYKTGDNEVTIDGLTPESVGYYPTTGAYAAKASLNSAGQLVIPSQFTGYYDSNGQIGWTPCTKFETGNGWYRDSTGPDCTLTYDASTGVWTSDYGMFLAIYSTYGDFTSWLGFYDVTNPGFQFTKSGELPDDPGDGGSGGGGGDDGGGGIGSGNDDGSLAGTYTASGSAYAGSGVDAPTTWTLKLYAYDASTTAHFPNYSGGLDYYIDGMCPSTEGSYDYYGDHRVSAAAYVDASGNLVVPTQVLNTTSSGYYVGWTPCTAYTAGSGWSYNYMWPDITFVYNSSSDCWESEYGVFMGAFTTTSLTPGTNSGFYSFFDVVSPGMTLTKTSDTTSLSSGAGSRTAAPLESLELHSDFKASYAPVSGSHPAVRSLGAIRQGDAKLAK